MTDSIVDSTPVLDRFSLRGRTALVTGGGQGIGRGYAHALAEAGARVAVVDLSEVHAQAVTEELRAKGADAIPLVTDVTSAEELENTIEKIEECWGSLTIAVNNAGVAQWADAEGMTREDWRKIMSLNLDAVFHCAQAEARLMFEAGYGKIINTASMSAHIVNTPQHQSAYNASKAAVLHLTRSLAAEWAPRGVRVNSISPGYTRTKLVKDLLATPVGKEMYPKWMSLTPMGRMGEVGDLQGAVVYLASAASDFMTGHDMVVDGGYCCW